ncbi:MAG: peptidylprolyl isomerase [Acidobacteriota bacterium]|jgi:peptidyl-prolyl cis-trans isomerase A (cyclophilin A)
MPKRTFLLTVMLATLLIFPIAPGSAQDPESMQLDQEILMNPNELNEKAPNTFQVLFDTSKGEFTVEVHRSWAPKGADRFYNLVKNGYYDNCRFFRVVKGFMVQFGINGDPQLNAVWRSARIEDDPGKESNKRAYITFAHAGPNTRTTQLFINYADNTFLDAQGFPPFGQVTKGMEVVDAINDEYGENPDQRRIQLEGNTYLEQAFPNLDFVKQAIIAPGSE